MLTGRILILFSYSLKFFIDNFLEVVVVVVVVDDDVPFTFLLQCS